MTSKRLKAVYNTARWRGPIRDEVLERAGHQCQQVEWSHVFGTDVRCQTMDRRLGGRQSLLVDHIKHDHPDPFDTSNLQALCAMHSGRKDGGRAHAAPRRSRTAGVFG